MTWIGKFKCEVYQEEYITPADIEEYRQEYPSCTDSDEDIARTLLENKMGRLYKSYEEVVPEELVGFWKEGDNQND